MATKTANVTARVQPEIKQSAEAILEKLGIPVSVFIDMSYRQVIMHDGIPFSIEIPQNLNTRDIMSKDEFDSMMQMGLEQAKKDDSSPVSEVLQNLRMRISLEDED